MGIDITKKYLLTHPLGNIQSDEEIGEKPLVEQIQKSMRELKLDKLREQESHIPILPDSTLPEVAAQSKRLPNKCCPSHTNYPFTLSKELTMEDYIQNNRNYVDSIHHNYGNSVFDSNGKGQAPHTLWIGCSDLRAGEGCLAALPGEIFTHRNIANIIHANDISLQGVIQFAIDVLKVRKVIVCGHTDCGGVWASLSSRRTGGVLDLWLNHVRHVRASNLMALQEFTDPKEKVKRLAELNVISSVTAIKRHPSASMALKNGEIEVWGMMYDVSTGLLSQVPIPHDEFSDLFHVHDDHIDGEDQPH